MKGVPIKFRGKDIITKEYLYGDYISHDDGTCAIRVKDRDNLFDFHEYEVAVEKDSVAQLVGYDVNGDEVYEGDILCAPYGNPIHFQAGVAFLKAMCDDFGTKIVLNADSVMEYKLKLKKGK